MKSSVILIRNRANAPKNYLKLFRPESATLQSGYDLQAQSLLGIEGFAEGLRHLVTEKQQIREIPKGQRFVGRPSLEKLFSQRSPSKAPRERLIAEAITARG